MTLAEIARQIPKDPNPTELLDALRRAFELGVEESAIAAETTAQCVEEKGYKAEALSLRAFADGLRITKSFLARAS